MIKDAQMLTGATNFANFEVNLFPRVGLSLTP